MGQTRTSFGAGVRAAGVAGVHDSARLDQHHVALAHGDRAMLDAARHDVHLARPELDAAVAQLDRHAARR
jgi:hypothetical protein